MPTRTPFIAANWKMFKTVDETVAYLREFCALAAGVTGAEIVVAPPFTALRAAAEVAKGHAASASPRRTATGSARAPSPVRSAPP